MVSELNKNSKFSANLIDYIDQVALSYHKYTNKPLIENHNNLIDELYDASFVFASHRYFDDDEPRFVFGNAKALELWELDWDNFIGMPSRLTAEAIHQDERECLLQEVNSKGHIKNYSGIRISSTGKRFQINNAIVWNVLNSSEEVIGQAVKFNEYQYLDL